MYAVWQKIKADLASRPLISGLIVLTIAAASTLLTLALATLLNLRAPYDQSFSELNAAHLWLYFDRDLTRAHDIETVEHLPGVVESTGLQYSRVARVRIHGTRVWVSLRAMPLAQLVVNQLMVQAGRYLLPGRTEALAGKDLAFYSQLAVGDTIDVTRADGKEVQLPVAGVVYNSMWDVYRTSQPSYIYVTEATLRELFPDDATWDWSVGLRLSDPDAVSGILAQARALLRPKAIAGYTDWRDVRESALFDVQINFVFLGAFSLFAILATVLVIATNVSNTVLSQFRQIGILKAVGFDPAQILYLYLGQYAVLGLAGGVLGLLAGIALSPLPLQSVTASLSATYRPPVDPALIGLALALVLGIVLLAAFGAARQGARVNIIRAMATGAEAPRQKVFWVVTAAERLGLPPVLVLGLNDVFAKPFRSLMTGLSLTLGVIGMVFGLALNETINRYRAEPALAGIVYDAVATAETTSDSAVQRLLRRAPGVAAFYRENVVEVEMPDGRSFRVRAVDGNLAAFPFYLPEGRFFEPGTYEAVAGRGLLDWLGLKLGAEITARVKDGADHPVTWQIVGQYVEPANAGQMLMVSWPTLERFVKDAPATYYLKLDPQANPPQLKKYLQPGPEADINLTVLGQQLPDTIIYLQLSIFVLAGILIGIALVNVFTTSLLAMQEKVRMIGVLKTIGMTPGQVAAMVNTSAGTLGLLAAVAGIPLGLVFTQGLLGLLSQAYGFSLMVVTVNNLYLLLLVPGMAGVSMLGSLLPARQAARLNIVRVLRAE